MTVDSKRALVISHEPDGPARQVEFRLVERGFIVDTHVVTASYDKPNDAAPWPSFDGYDLIVPMGSVRSLTNKEEIAGWIHTELDLLSAAHEAGTPILGVCFGGQLLADALGGSVELAPVTEIGWFEVEAPEGAKNPVGPGPWLEWHHDKITPPPEADVLAVNENAVQLFRIGRSVGTQFHPEVDTVHVAEWLRQAGDDYLAANGIIADQMMASMIEHEDRNIKQCKALVDWFLDDVAFPEALPDDTAFPDEVASPEAAARGAR